MVKPTEAEKRKMEEQANAVKAKKKCKDQNNHILLIIIKS